MTTLNPLSSNFTYAYQRDHAIEITKAVVKSMFYVAAAIACLATAAFLGFAAGLAIGGAIPLAITPAGAGLLIAGIGGLAMGFFIAYKIMPVVVDNAFKSVLNAHRLIWN